MTWLGYGLAWLALAGVTLWMSKRVHDWTDK